MSMEGAAWSSLYKISTAKDGGGFSRESIRRILAFATPYRAQLVIFIALSVVGAFLAVATPVLAGQVVDVIAARGAVARSSGSRSSSPWWRWPTPARRSRRGGTRRGSARA